MHLFLYGAILAGVLIMVPRSSWAPPAAARPYLPTIYAAEDAHGLPRNLLARVLHQESRYRDDIISGALKSRVGAVGIAQFMPATAAEWGVDPLNTESAIFGAARYLRWLYDQLGSWKEAVAAYNWGIGNVQRKGLAQAPKETRDYIAEVLGDVPV